MVRWVKTACAFAAHGTLAKIAAKIIHLLLCIETPLVDESENSRRRQIIPAPQPLMERIQHFPGTPRLGFVRAMGYSCLQSKLQWSRSHASDQQ
jgi:hypothetical protein